jgi:hypothetical protein
MGVVGSCFVLYNLTSLSSRLLSPPLTVLMFRTCNLQHSNFLLGVGVHEFHSGVLLSEKRHAGTRERFPHP